MTKSLARALTSGAHAPPAPCRPRLAVDQDVAVGLAKIKDILAQVLHRHELPISFFISVAVCWLATQRAVVELVKAPRLGRAGQSSAAGRG